MKSRIIYIVTILCVLVVSVSFYRIDTSSNRVHQHLDERWQHLEEDDKATHLPILSIQTNGQQIPGSRIIQEDGTAYTELSDTMEEFIVTDLTLIDGQKGSNHISDEPTVESLANIHIRGNSSRYFDKKSYSIHLVDEDGKENPQSLVGMSSHDEWVLYGPILDRSYIRNYLCMNIAGEIMEYAPDVRFCELWINDEYQGLYLLMETISRGEGRIEINKTDDNSYVTSFIVCWDRIGKGDHELNNFTYYTYESDQSALDIRYPGNTTLTEAKEEYICQQISQVEKMLYSMSLWEESYTDYLDLDSFAEYFIINEFFRNIDAGQFSTFLYQDVRGKMKTAVWDFNNCCDNNMDGINNEIGFSMQNGIWFNQLLKDRNFVTLVVEKYHQLRKGPLSTAYLLNYIDETDTWLGEAIIRNDEVWGYVYDLDNYNIYNYLSPIDRNMESHEEAIEQIKHFIEERGQWLDEHIESLYQYCSESKNANEMLR